MTKRGISPWMKDPLSEAVGTVVKSASEITLKDLQYFGQPIGLDPAAVYFGQPLNGGQISLSVTSPVLRGMSDVVERAIRRTLPAEIDFGVFPESESYIRTVPAYALQLIPVKDRDLVISTVKAFIGEISASAAAASKVFKQGQAPTIPFRVHKQYATERIVTGAVMVPDIPDGTVTKESDADIYSEVEVTKAMYWWMENAGQAFSYHHVPLGGQKLAPGEVIILENFQARTTYKEGGQEIPKGTWMLSTRVRNDQLWTDIVNGKINAWSVGINALGALERVDM
jgi:hypothetical protein